MENSLGKRLWKCSKAANRMSKCILSNFKAMSYSVLTVSESRVQQVAWLGFPLPAPIINMTANTRNYELLKQIPVIY